jgi:hypothetical protein
MAMKRLTRAERAVRGLPVPVAPGVAFRDPRSMTSQERRQRVAGLQAKFCAREGIDPTDTAAMFQRRVENAEERGDHAVAERWRRVAAHRASALTPTPCHKSQGGPR